MPHPESSEHSSPAYSISQCGTASRAAMTRERIWPWDTEATCSQGGTWLGQWWPSLVLTQGAYQKQPRTLVVAIPPQLMPPTYTENPNVFHNRVGVKEAVRGKGNLNPWLCLNRERETTAGAFMGSVLETAQTSLCSQHGQRTHVGPPCLGTLPSGTKVLVLGEGKVHT